MASPKEKVRANIYRELFMEEKKKNKRNTVFSLSLFVLGVFTSSAYQMITSPLVNTQNFAMHNATKKENISIDHFFNKNLFEDNKVELNTDDLFGLERQI